MDLPPKEQFLVFENIWNPIEENARDLVKQKSLVSDYIRDYLTLKTKKIPNKSNVYAEFKRLYGNKKEDGFQQDLENIKSLSEYASMMEKATDLSNKMSNAGDQLSTTQMSRFMKMQTKLANAAANL
jgi:hypothetical protein